MPDAFADLRGVIEGAGQRGAARIQAITLQEVYRGINAMEAFGLAPVKLVGSDARAVASGEPAAVTSVLLAVDAKVLLLQGAPRGAMIVGALSWAAWGAQHLFSDHAEQPPQVPDNGLEAQIDVDMPPMWERDP